MSSEDFFPPGYRFWSQTVSANRAVLDPMEVDICDLLSATSRGEARALLKLSEIKRR